MNYQNIFMQIGISVVVLAILIVVIALMISQMGIQIQESQQLTYEKCCNNIPCSDTYYDLETKTCKLVFEEQQKYYPFNKLNLISLVIVFGVSLVLAFGVAMIGRYTNIGSPANDEQLWSR